MMENKRNAMFIGMIIGLIIGVGVGLALDNFGLGIGLGVAYGTALGVALSKRKPIKDKKKARIFSWTMLFSSGLGFLLFGTIIGDVFGGLAAAIGISFVIGLKWERLYDERVSGIFSKAARNSFVTVNAGLSIAFIARHTLEETLSSISTGELTSYIVYFSWIVFLISWIYHGNYIGE
jgi:hypothetical protein